MMINRDNIKQGSWKNIWMSQCKKEVTPLLTHWSYVFLAITHRNNSACLMNVLYAPPIMLKIRAVSCFVMGWYLPILPMYFEVTYVALYDYPSANNATQSLCFNKRQIFEITGNITPAQQSTAQLYAYMRTSVPENIYLT